MNYDPVKDCTLQYRQFIAAGMPHDVAIDNIELRLGQSKKYEIDFKKTLKALDQNNNLRNWWSDQHAPFTVKLPEANPNGCFTPTYPPPDTSGYIESWAQRNGKAANA